MKFTILLSLVFGVGFVESESLAQTIKAPPLIKKEAETQAVRSPIVDKARDILDKQPKSLFLIKKAKINSEVGGPLFYPVEAQLRTIINDSTLHNFKKYE